MTSDQWEKARQIFVTAIKLSPELRLPYLDEVCANDAATRREVESLLASHDGAEGFMETPAVGEVADAIHEAKNLERGKYFGHYEIIEKIGAGGMGEVYLAADKKLDRSVAIKILSERFAGHRSNLNRFIQEAKAASGLNHPNILVIHEIGEDENIQYIVSEFIQGKTLREILREKTLELGEILDISIQIVSALCAAHEAGLVHRDIKPENVILRADGLVKVLDFGLAKFIGQNAGGVETATVEQNRTAEGIILGTVNYMSPEQARGERVDARTDIFSFGTVLYEMLTGQNPFKGETINHTIIAILDKEAPPLSQFIKDFPVEIERIVCKCLEKDLQKRYGSTKDLLADLKALEKRLEFEAELERTSRTSGKNTSVGRQDFKTVIDLELPFLSPNNLIESLTPLIGREKEIAEIKNLLEQPEIRLVTLTGIGGAGKTRLSLAAAQDLLPDFPDGVFLVELAAISSAELVASAIAQPLGVKEAGGRPILEIVKDYLGDKKMLLVIDNFEQVTDAAPQIGELLSAASRLKILITSRTLLRLSAEREFVVPPLALPSEIREVSSEALASYDAVKLFVQRAQNAAPAFVLTAENTRSVAEICTRLDGLPLAIELAAARVKILAPQVILAKLENRLRLLTGGARDLPARQQTMRGAIEWSYGLLSEDEKNIFRRLSVFSGGFIFEAAEAVVSDQWPVAGENETEKVNSVSNNQAVTKENEQPATGHRPLTTDIDFLDLLTSLVEKSLLVTIEQSTVGGTRFRMLEVVREYAFESLEASGEAENLHRRHAEYFVALGEAAEPHLLTVQGVEWFNRLKEEHENLRAALEWSLEKKPVEAARLAGALRNFWATHCHFTEGRKYLQSALERGGHEIPVAVRFKLFNGLGSLTRMQGDYAVARRTYEQGLIEGKAADDLRQIAHSNRGLGLVIFQQGDPAAARRFMEEGLKILRRLGDNFGIALTLTSLGDIERVEGNTAAARLMFEESLAICRQLSNKAASVSTLSNLGAVAFEDGDFAASYSYFAESLATARELEEKVIISLSLDGFAALAMKRGETAQAARLAGAAQYLREQIGYEIEPTDLRFREKYLKELKIGMDEADFSKFYEQGRILKPEEAIALISGLEQ